MPDPFARPIPFPTPTNTPSPTRLRPAPGEAPSQPDESSQPNAPFPPARPVPLRLLPAGGGSAHGEDEAEDAAAGEAEGAAGEDAADLDDEILVGLVGVRPRRRRPAAEPEAAAAYPVVPLLPIGEPIDAAGEAWLTARAAAARSGDLAALEALHRALGPRIDGWVARCVARSRPTARRDGRPWLADDLRQEAWFALARTLETWPGEGSGSFLPWLLAVMPFRLADRWQTLLGPEPRREPMAPPPLADDDGFAASETRLLLEALAARLADPRDRLLLLGHVGDGLPLTRFVGAAGATPGVVYGRWRRLRVWLRAELAPARDAGRGGDIG